MDQEKLQEKLSFLVSNISEDNFVYGLLDVYNFPRATVTLLKKESDKLSRLKNQIIIRNKLVFHRTVNELEDKDAITQQQMGGHLAYKTRRLNVGLTGIHSQLNSDFTPTLATYSQFRNDDNKQTNLGIDYNWIYKNFNFFGEFSKSLTAGNAFVSGALITLDPKLSLAVLYRDYQRDFQPISSAGLGEGSTNENEKGMYMGFIAKPAKKWTLSAYYDQFTFPWLKFGINAPSKGYQYLAQLTDDLVPVLGVNPSNKNT